ncbi:MAG: hypothetical protein JWM11_1833 [Planctomycetaceae bacterium]|nr:hypothetical protein [Planctomycetaceae bacterium]
MAVQGMRISTTQSRESRILIGGFAVWCAVVGIQTRCQAKDHPSHLAVVHHQTHPDQVVLPSHSDIAATPNAPVSSGFHPDFSRPALREISNRAAIQTAIGTQGTRYALVHFDKSKEKPKEHQEKSGKHNPKPEPKHEPKHEPPAEKPHPAEKPKHDSQNDRGSDSQEPKHGTKDTNRNDRETGKGKVESRKSGTDKSVDQAGDDPIRSEKKVRSRQTGDGTDPEKNGKIKIRQPHERPVGGNPSRDLGQRESNSQIKELRIKDGQTLSRDHLLNTRRDFDLQHAKLRAGKPPERISLNMTPDRKQANAERLERLPREQFRIPVSKNGRLDPKQIERLKLRPAGDVFHERLKNGDLNRYSHLKSGNAYHMQRQFALHQTGDISRRMNLLPALQARGGWRHRHFGAISPLYAQHCRSMWYPGPAICGPYLWYPKWGLWVDWCWWDRCSVIYDPRPRICRPVHHQHCAPWIAWQYPVWQPLPLVSCGTWVNVDPVVINNGVDVQLLATRFVDPGHPDQQLGPRFRVWFRNNSPFAINQPFNVLLLASNDGSAREGLPEAGLRIPGMAPGEIQSVDIRLPFAANVLGRSPQNNATPFSYLSVFVDSHNELVELNKANNGATLVRGDILPVDPVIFAADPAHIEPQGIVHLAGEGFGPEPGKALVVIGDQEFDAEILGWFDLGVQLRIPDFALDAATAADLVIIRGDGAASQPLTIEIDPGRTDSAYEEPAPETLIPGLPAPPPLPE